MVSPVELTCQELVELVTEYLEGKLPSSEQARFEAHLGVCPGCTTYLDQMRETIRLVGRLSEEAISPEAESDLLKIFRDWKRSSLS